MGCVGGTASGDVRVCCVLFSVCIFLSLCMLLFSLSVSVWLLLTPNTGEESAVGVSPVRRGVDGSEKLASAECIFICLSLCVCVCVCV